MESDWNVSRSGGKTMPLDPQVKVLLDQIAAAAGPQIHTLSAPDARRMTGKMFQVPPEKIEKVFKVEDRKIPGPAGSIPIPVYKPEGNGPFPVLVFFHGGRPRIFHAHFPP